MKKRQQFLNMVSQGQNFPNFSKRFYMEIKFLVAVVNIGGPISYKWFFKWSLIGVPIYSIGSGTGYFLPLKVNSWWIFRNFMKWIHTVINSWRLNIVEIHFQLDYEPWISILHNLFSIQQIPITDTSSFIFGKFKNLA